jgi:GntR family transcriptional regulator
MTRQSPAQKRVEKERVAKSPSLKLDARSLYETCADVLSREIAQGGLKPGQRLASERALADKLGFTRLTVRRALQELAERGLLEPDERRGWQVAGGPVSEPLNALMGFTQMARQRGLVATSRILSLEHREATIEESESLRIAPGAPMLDLSRLRLLDDRPTAIERLRMAESRVRWPPKFDFTGSIYAALESQGINPSRADAFVGVVDATVAEAELLAVAPGRGLLCINCVTARADGLAFSLETTKYHPDRYRFRAVLERHATP